MPNLPCPDCGATTTASGQPQHDPSCPLGKLTDVTCEHDRLWFLNHPNAREYRREVTPDESASLLAVTSYPPGEGYAVVGRVRVVQLSAGVRARDFSGVRVVPRPPAQGGGA